MTPSAHSESARSRRRLARVVAVMVAAGCGLFLVGVPGYAQDQTVWAGLSADPTSGPAPLDVTFSTGGTDGQIAEYTLAFGDGTSQTQKGPPPASIGPHTYQTAKTYTAVLTVRGDNGSTDDASVTITVNPKPKPSPSPEPKPTKTADPPNPGPGPNPPGGGGGGEDPEPPTDEVTPTASASPSPSPSPTRTRRPDRDRRPGRERIGSPRERRDDDDETEEGAVVAIDERRPGGGQDNGERSEFVRSLRDPSEVSLSLRTLAESLLLAALLVLLVGFPADMFNATLLQHYEEITGWFDWAWLDRLRAWLTRLPSPVVLVGFAATGALLYAQLSPDFGFNRGSLALLAGMFASFLVVSLTYDVARAIYIRRRFKVSSKIRAQVAGIVVGTVLVIFSRIADFQPGYIYGVFTALVFRGSVDERDDGRALGLASIWLGGIAIAAWFLWMPVNSMATEAGASLWVLALDAGLASLWVAGLGAIVFGLVPLRFFYGAAVRAWSRRGWFAIYGTGMLFFALVLLHPDQAVYGSDDISLIAVLSLFLGFGAFSLAFWAYFRYRHLWRRTKPGTA